MPKQKKSAKSLSRKPPSKDPHKEKKTTWIICILLFLCTFLLYANTLNHDYALDDDIYTKKNVYVQQGFSALKDIFNKGSLYGFNGINDAQYRPIALLNFMIETQLFGLNPRVSHFFNIFFYALTCLMVFLFLKKILKKYPLEIAALASLLFAFHPIHTEVVANIKSRDEILSFLFGVTSFYLLMRYVEHQNKRYLILSVFIFFLSTLSKETSLMFAFVISLTLYFFSQWPLKKIIITSLPYFAMVVLYLIIRSSVMTSVTFNEKMIVMNNALMAAETKSEMLATNFVLLGKYVWMLFFPYPLSWDYSYQQIPIVGWSSFKAFGSLLLYLALAGFVTWKLKTKNIYAYCILFFGLTLILTSNLIVKIGATFGERFLYAPSLAFCMALPISIFSLAKKKNSANTIYAITIPVLIIYALITMPRNTVWKNNFTLFASGVETSPNSARTHFSLAIEYRTQGEQTPNLAQRQKLYVNSIKYFNSGLRLYAKDYDAWYNMGVTYYQMGDRENALRTYLKTIELKPGYIGALNNIGVIYFERKDYDKALTYFNEVLKYDSNYADAYANIGAVYHNKGDHNKAIIYYEKAIALKPGILNVYDNLIKIYSSQGNKEKADYYSALKQGGRQSH